MKYHCTKRPYQDLSLDDRFMKFIKIINLGKCMCVCVCVWHKEDVCWWISYYQLRIKYPLKSLLPKRFTTTNVRCGCYNAHHTYRICSYAWRWCSHLFSVQRRQRFILLNKIKSIFFRSICSFFRRKMLTFYFILETL